jgi:lipopolysaccharide/colanic/teichoic acid biosynthesis glycosyltransferase
MKRAFDVVVSCVGLALLAAPFALIALAIKLSSPGPILYRQQRIGRGGRPFALYKFRTMRTVAGGPLITVEGDARSPRWGGSCAAGSSTSCRSC